MAACAYCAKARGVTEDHVVPRSLRKKYGVPKFLNGTVRACYACNVLKGSRRLVPPSWEQWITALNEAYPGTEWRVWRGDKKEEAFSKVHV